MADRLFPARHPDVKDADLLVADGRPERPRVAVVADSSRLDPATPSFTAAPPPSLVFTSRRADPHERAQIEAVGEVVNAGVDTVDPRRVVEELTRRGHRRIHSEGGPELGSFLEVGVVDGLCSTLSPSLVGGLRARVTARADERAAPLELMHVLRSGSMLFLRCRVRAGGRNR